MNIEPKDTALFESAFRFASIGMAIVSLEGKWLKINPSLSHMLGYTQEELLSLDFQQLTHPEDLEADLKLVSALLESEISTYQLEKRYFRKDGTIVWGLLSVSLKAAEMKLIETERLKTLLRFSIQVAHEVNNPLTIIGLNALTIKHAISQPVPDVDRIKQSLFVLNQAIERIAVITNTLNGVSVDTLGKEFDPKKNLSLLLKKFHLD